MATEIRTIEDLIRIIQEHPEWRRELLIALLGEEFLHMPDRLLRVEEVLAQLVASHARLTERVERLIESHEHLAGSHQRLTESHEQLTARVEQLTESHQRLAESHERLAESHKRLAESHQQLTESHQRLAESHERLAESHQQLIENHQRLAESHERLAESHQRLTESHERLIEEVRELRAIVEQLVFRMGRAESDIAHLRGEVLEIRYQQRAPALFGYYVRRPRVINVGHFLDDLREEGHEFTQDEWIQLAAIDLIVSARHPQTREPLYLVVEVSRVIYPDDVQRAIERAEMLRQRGLSTYPAVAGEGIDPEARELAERTNTFVLLNGVAIANGIRI
ncbi:Chromosome partition protein Smc [bacterium HR15]|nr:Chromosome partition protein Smc [bacterium HR15]